jgi:hypothetical protein
MHGSENVNRHREQVNAGTVALALRAFAGAQPETQKSDVIDLFRVDAAQASLAPLREAPERWSCAHIAKARHLKRC